MKNYTQTEIQNHNNRQKNRQKKMSISEHLTEFINNEHNNLCSGGMFTTKNFMLLSKALSGELDNFVVFDNAGGKAFDIIQNDGGVKGFAKDMKRYVYMQKINGKETIIRNLPTNY